MNEATDAQLVLEAARAGDHRAFGELVKRYQGRVFGLAYAITGDRAEAEDLAQECFIRAYLKLPELRD